MPHVYRKSYTAPIPADAERITVKVKARGKTVEAPGVRFRKDGKTTTAPLTASGDRIRLESPSWYGYVNGEEVKLCTNRQAAEVMLADRIRDHERGRAGMLDPFEPHEDRSALEHLDDWQAALLAAGAGAKHVGNTVGCVRRVIEGCSFDRLSAIEPVAVQTYLAGLRGQSEPIEVPDAKTFKRKELAGLLGLSMAGVTDLVRRHRLPATGNGKARTYPRETALALVERSRSGLSSKSIALYLDGMKAFTRWLADNGRIPSDPLAKVKANLDRGDRRHDRQTLTEEQLRSIVESARTSTESFRGLTGPDRAALYVTAMTTGYRAEELACLTPANFDLDVEVPCAFLRGDQTKNGQPARQPLPPSVVDLLKGYLAGRTPRLPVWPGSWFKRAADMLRIDLEHVGIPYIVEAPDGRPLHADFHCLRHSYIAMLDRTGATLKEAMTLARHSDPKLTMAVYGRAQLHSLAGAVAELPDLTSTPKKKTRRKMA